MPKKPAQKKIDAAIGELDKVRSQWLRRPNVTAVDVGFKIKDRKLTDELAVRVHVDRKLPVASLETHEVLSESGSPSKLGDFPVDVVEATYGPSQVPAPAPASGPALEPEAVDRRSRVDPLVAGVSVGNPRVTAGTLGAIVYDRTDCRACILSNWHVLAGNPAAMAGEDIFQPGVADGGTPADTVAQLERFRLDRDMDAGLARLDSARGVTRDVLGLDPIAGVEEAALGTNVIKSGRTTAVTEGVIDGVSTSLAINYRNAGVVQMFHDQIHIVPRPPWPAVDYEVSLGGDSGSVWINEATNRAVGLHFAGENNVINPAPAAENAVANRMTVVADELDFSFTPLFCPPGPIGIDPRLRDVLRRILCRRFPWLCGDPFPFPPIFRGGPAGDEPAAGGSGVQAAPRGADVEEIVDEIVAVLKRPR